MPEYMTNGIAVSFPFEPYSVQAAYMEKVIECLKRYIIHTEITEIRGLHNSEVKKGDLILC